MVRILGGATQNNCHSAVSPDTSKFVYQCSSVFWTYALENKSSTRRSRWKSSGRRRKSSGRRWKSSGRRRRWKSFRDRKSEKGEVLLSGVGTLRCLFSPDASLQWQPGGLTIHTNKWFLGAGFLGAFPISLRKMALSWGARRPSVCSRRRSKLRKFWQSTGDGKWHVFDN